MDWRGQKIFLTGHTGFMGGWLLSALAQSGAHVTGYSLAPPTEPNLYGAARLHRHVSHRSGDVRDANALAAAMAECRPVAVFHLAAQPLVLRARRHPLETFSTNVLGTANVLEAVRHTPSVKTVIVVTSDKVYDNTERTKPYREDDRLGGKEPYGASKASCELVVDAWRNAYLADRGIASVRIGNVIGGGDWADDRLVPDAMRAFAAGKPLLVRHPAAVRPWQHVLEPVACMLGLAERLLAGPTDACGAWNIGPLPEDARPVGWVADRLVAAWSDGASWQSQRTNDAPYEACHLSVDSAKVQAALGWRPRWRLNEAIERTVDWYRQYYQGREVAHLTAEQTEGFLHAA